MRDLFLVLASLFIITACDDKKTTEAIAPPAVSVTPPAVVSAAPSAPLSLPSTRTGGVADSAVAKPMFGCKTKVGDVKMSIEVFDAAKGSPIANMKVESKPTPRSFTATTAPHAATYTLVFSGYGEGDKHPAAEPTLVPGDTVLGRLVANGDKMEFYADKGFPTRPSKDGPYICEK